MNAGVFFTPIPLYWSLHPTHSDSFYSTSEQEVRESVTFYGYEWKGVAFYVAPNDAPERS